MKIVGADAETWGLTLLAVSEVPNFLAGMAPSLFTLQHMGAKSPAHRAEVRATMRRAYVVGGGLSLAVGLGASLVSESWLPFLGTVIVFAILVHQYEWAIASPHDTGEEMFQG